MQYQIGQIVEGVVTGIQPYGAFITIDKLTTGLVHISEISSGFVKDVAQFVSVGDVVSVKIIDFDEKNHQARLSLKAALPNRFRKDRKFVKSGLLPASNIGFNSIKENLEEWIRKAKEEQYDSI